MKGRLFLSAIALTLAASAPALLFGCGSSAFAATDLMTNIKPNTQAGTSASLNDSQADALADFGVRLLQLTSTSSPDATNSDNVLVSPLSVEYALGMTANGAQGETLSQMESVLGMPVDQLNQQMHVLMLACEGSGESDATSPSNSLKIANSIWIRDGFDVSSDFLQTNADYYNASMYQAAFDNTTVSDINQWVSDHTNNLIQKILRDISPEAAMYLVNAIAFDAEWEDPYEQDQVERDIFSASDGTAQDVDFMYSTESSYLESDLATGFIKPYSDTNFAFAALLPNEGTSVDELLAELDGASLRSMLSGAQAVSVKTSLPKFESEYDTNLAEVLATLGMTDAFDGNKADFSGMVPEGSNGDLCISRVLHKTYIAVDELGTKAGAATAMEMKATSAIGGFEDPKTVYLDRPFVYMLISQQTNMPVFIGIVRSVA